MKSKFSYAWSWLQEARKTTWERFWRARFSVKLWGRQRRKNRNSEDVLEILIKIIPLLNCIKKMSYTHRKEYMR